MQQINNLSEHLLDHELLVKNALSRVVDSGWLVLGPEVQHFEHLFSKYIGTKHCVSVANGTDAIELALRALDINSGDLVATVANAGMYSTSAILAIGAKPYFMDVDYSTQSVTFDEVEGAIKAGAKTVVLTHLYGLVIPDIKNISLLCSEHDVTILEDCAQAHGARLKGKCAGSFGDIASFSFYPTKNLGAVGDGGAIVTDREELASKILALRQYGWQGKYNTVVAHGRNSRLDEIQAAVLNDLLPFLDGWNSRRRDIAARYNDTINHPEVILPKYIFGENYVGHLFVVCSQHRTALAEHLKVNEIISDVHYPIPDHRQAIFGGDFDETCLKTTEHLAKQVLTLPCYPEMTDKTVDLIADTVNGWVL